MEKFINTLNAKYKKQMVTLGTVVNELNDFRSHTSVNFKIRLEELAIISQSVGPCHGMSGCIEDIDVIRDIPVSEMTKSLAEDKHCVIFDISYNKKRKTVWISFNLEGMTEEEIEAEEKYFADLMKNVS